MQYMYRFTINSISLRQVINKATRVTASTSSCIDPILTILDKNKVRYAGVIENTICDHSVFFIELNNLFSRK